MKRSKPVGECVALSARIRLPRNYRYEHGLVISYVHFMKWRLRDLRERI